MIHKKLFVKDNKGKIRFWQIEQKNNSYRTISGLHNGKSIYSGWIYAEKKNPNKKNATTPEEQVHMTERW